MALALRPPPGRDPLLRTIVTHWILGALMGVASACVLLAGDIANLRTLIMRSDMLGPALALLFGGFAITFGGALAGAAVMLAPSDDDNDDRGFPAFRRQPELRPILVRARSQHRPRR
ncbi:MAG: hypothetical protein JWN93_1824 [Hyphomicrobiales bacterium]|jgi:hypothetical protein|nr:hypothetical protein [Hyphomicrobiales bacterium]